jgi:GNAT superfamily N-acetyltransferase
MIGPTQAAEADPILALARRVALFSEVEIATISELLTSYLDSPTRDYFFLSYRDDNRILGFACYGPRPLTQGVFDLYWICVERVLQGQGIGSALLGRVEQEVAAQAGRMVLIETSSTEPYRLTRSFYERCTGILS